MATQSFRAEVQRIIQSNTECPWLTLLSGQSQRMYSLRDLEERINDYCAFYHRHDVREGDTVVIILQESLDLFASFFAAMIYGALPAFYAYPSPKQSVETFGESVENLLEHNAVSIVIGFDSVIGALRSLNISEAKGLELVANSSVPKSQGFRFDNLPSPKQEAFMQFSSGTTGAKKSVVISAEALFNQIEAYESNVQFDGNSRVISWLPHYHDMGLIACMLMPFLRQVPVVMMSPFEWVKNPRTLLDAITTYQGSHVWLPNFALGHMTKNIQSDELAGINLRSLKKLILCSEPVLYETVGAFIDKFRQCGLSADRLENCYAMAENTFAMSSTSGEGIFYLEVDEDLFRKEHRIQKKPGGLPLPSAGRPLKNLSLSVLDESEHPLGEREVGEVGVRSNCLFEGYRNNPEASKDAFSNGWFKTGDLGFFHYGQLFITGRKKDMIIVGGENIYPQDIEAILNEEPTLIPGRNVAFGTRDTRVGTEKIVVLAETKDGHAKIDENQIRTKVTNTLNVAIAEVIFLPHMTLRKCTAGKISRSLNKEAYLNGAFTNVDRGELGRSPSILDVVVDIIPATMKEPINEETPLLSSSLIDSFGFVSLVQRLESCFGVKIPEELWQESNFQTIHAIRETIASLDSGSIPADSPHVNGVKLAAEREKSLATLKSKLTAVQDRGSMLERWINHFPFRGSLWYRWLFRLAGIQLGRNVQFLGKVNIKLRGAPQNISIGDNVVLGDGVDLRNRENGKIQLKERVYLDRNVRVVAARDGIVEIGFGSEIGTNTTINSGGTTRIGEYCLIAGGVNINSSRHGIERAAYVKAQPHSHGSIELGDDVWVGSGASIIMNTKIGNGVIVSSNSLVKGEFPEFAICAGVPAKVIRYR